MGARRLGATGGARSGSPIGSWVVADFGRVPQFQFGSGSAGAQTADGRGACKADYDKYCAGTPPGGGRVVACLNKQQNQLSDACKKVLAGRKKQ